MDSTNITDLNELETPFVREKEKPLDFSMHMMEEPETEDDDSEANLETQTTLMDGPFVAPLLPNQLPFVASRMIASLPEELRPLIEPLPAIIKTSFKTGVLQTKLTIPLSSLENVEVVIDQYDTAPNAFHISFYGSEQTGAQISLKQNELISILQAALPNFSFAVSPPFIAPPSFSLPKSKRLGYSPVNKGKSKK